MAEFSSSFSQPLVLHGGSGIPTDMIKKAITSGEAKIKANKGQITQFPLNIQPSNKND